MRRVVHALRGNGGQALAVGLAAAVLSLVAAVPPLFLSSAGSAALQVEAQRFDQDSAGFRLVIGVDQIGPVPRHRLYDNLDEVVRQVAGTTDVLGRGRLTMTADLFQVRPSTGPPVPVELIARDDAISFVGGREDVEGLWLPDTLAEELDLAPGDEVGFDRGQLPDSFPAVVAGTYPDPVRQPPSTFWRGVSTRVYGNGVTFPKPVVLTSPEYLGELVAREFAIPIAAIHAGGLPQVPARPTTTTWDFGLRLDGLTLPEAEAGQAAVEALVDQVYDEESELGFALHRRVSVNSPPNAGTLLPFIVGEARSATEAMAAPTWTVAVAAVGVGLIAMATVALLTGRARRTEAELRTSQGLGRGKRAAMVAAETSLPVLVGAVVGCAAAWALVRLVGRSVLLDPGALRSAVLLSVAAATLGWAVVAWVASDAGRVVPVRRRGWLAATPWELLPLTVAVAGMGQVVQRGGAILRDDGGPVTDALVVALPIAALIGVAGLAVRALRRLLPLLRRLPRTPSGAVWLASRRVAAAGGAALGLVAGAIAAVGIVTYAAAMTASTAATVDAKAATRTGAEVVLDVAASQLPPAEPLGIDATFVRRGAARLEPSGVEVDVLGVDEDTLPGVTGTVGAELLAPLAASAGGAVPVIVAGSGLGGTTDVLRLGVVDVAIEAVDEVEAFPGMDPDRPLIVASWAVLDEAFSSVSVPEGIPGAEVPWQAQLWTYGDVESVRTAATDAGLFVIRTVEASAVETAVGATQARWVLGLFAALGLLSASLTLVGLAAYVHARQRDQAVFSTLAARLRLTRAMQWSAVAIELIVLLTIAAAVGAVTGLAIAWFMTVRLDPLPALQPGPQFVIPVLVLAATLPVLTLAAAVAAGLSQRAAGSADPATVMRTAQ